MLLTVEPLYQIAMAADNFEELVGQLIELDIISVRGTGDGASQFCVAFNELKEALKPYRLSLKE